MVPDDLERDFVKRTMYTMLFLVHVWRKVTSSSHLAEGAKVKSL